MWNCCIYCEQNATPIVVSGLRKLEYRGYDSAGIAVLQNGKLRSEGLPERSRNSKNLSAAILLKGTLVLVIPAGQLTARRVSKRASACRHGR